MIDRAALLRLALAAAAGGRGFPANLPRWSFTLVSYNTIDPLFVALQYGAEDAAALAGCSVSWTGSAAGDVGEVAKAIDAAVDGPTDGIALAAVAPEPLAGPIARAVRARIPLLALNVRAPGIDLPLVGLDPGEAGAALGRRIAATVGHGEIALFVGDPARAALGPLADATLAAIEHSGRPVTGRIVGTGPDIYAQLDTVYQFASTRRDVRGLFALDVGSTQGLTNALEKLGPSSPRVHAGGSGVLPETLQLIEAGTLDFTVDEQPYLEGFAATLALFLARVSGGLLGPPEVQTGPVFVTTKNVRRYLDTKTRYEGSSSLQKYPVSG